MLNWIKLNPSAITGAVMALVNMLMAYGVALTPDEAAATGIITTAVLTVVAAVLTRPVGLQAIVGGAVTIVGALGAFRFHPTSAQVTTAATVLSLVLAVAFHFAHVPVASGNKTAYQVQGVPVGETAR